MLPHEPARRNLNTVVESNLVTDIPQDPPGPDYDYDAIFARRLRLLREAARLTQRQLADRMTQAGCRMLQTTVSKVEAGERPVSVGEAATFAAVLGTGVSALVDARVDSRDLDDWLEYLGALNEKVERAREQVARSLARVDDDRARLEVAEQEARGAAHWIATMQRDIEETGE